MSAKSGHSLLQEIFYIATSEHSNNPSNMSWVIVKAYAETLLALEEQC